MMKKISLWVAALLLWTVPAAAQTIDSLGAAGALDGTESVPMFQTANPAVKATAKAIANTADALNASTINAGTLAAARMPALTGNCVTVAGAVATTCEAPHPGYIANNWYVSPSSAATGGTGNAVLVNTIACAYAMIPNRITISTLGIRIITAGSTNIQLAIYTNSAGRPAALLSSTANIANTGTGVVSGALGANKQVGPAGTDGGRDVWFCFNSGDGTMIAQSVLAGSLMAAAYVGDATQASVLQGANNFMTHIYCQGAACQGGSSTFGTWPAALGTTTWTNGGPATSGQAMPVVAFKPVSVP